MAYCPMTPSACMLLMASRVSFTDPLSANGCSLPSKAKTNGRRSPLPPPVDLWAKAPSCLRRDSQGRPYAGMANERYSLGGFAWPFAFQGALALFGADVHFDLLRLGFRLLGQADLQHAFVVVRRNLLAVHGLRQSEGASEAAVLTLHAAVVLFFLFLLDLALALNGKGVVLDAYIYFLILDSSP